MGLVRFARQRTAGFLLVGVLTLAGCASEMSPLEGCEILAEAVLTGEEIITVTADNLSNYPSPSSQDIADQRVLNNALLELSMLVSSLAIQDRTLMSLSREMGRDYESLASVFRVLERSDFGSSESEALGRGINRLNSAMTNSQAKLAITCRNLIKSSLR